MIKTNIMAQRKQATLLAFAVRLKAKVSQLMHHLKAN
jgi:hypothetical protein